MRLQFYTIPNKTGAGKILIDSPGMFDKFALLQRWIVFYVVRKLAMISRSYCATFDKFLKTNIKFFHRKKVIELVDHLFSLRLALTLPQLNFFVARQSLFRYGWISGDLSSNWTRSFVGQGWDLIPNYYNIIKPNCNQQLFRPMFSCTASYVAKL